MMGITSIIVISDDDEDEDEDDAVVVEQAGNHAYIKECSKTLKRKKSEEEEEEEEEGKEEKGNEAAAVAVAAATTTTTKATEKDDDDDDEEEEEDVIWIESRVTKCGNTSNVVLEKQTTSGNDDDCCILSCDPDSTVQVAHHVENEGEDIVVIAERGHVACRDYPHARYLCVKFPFKSTSHEKYCEQCHCYVCDILAPCLLWGKGNLKTDHCHAFDKDNRWKMMRDRARTPPVKLVGKPRVIRPPSYIPLIGVNNDSLTYSYQSAYHSSLDQWAANLNMPPSAQARSHARVSTTSLLPNIPPHPTGSFNGSTFIQASSDRVQVPNSCSRPNSVIFNRPSGMANSVLGRVVQSANVHSSMRPRSSLNHVRSTGNLAVSGRSRNVLEGSGHSSSGGFHPHIISIANDLLTSDSVLADNVLRQSRGHQVVAQKSNMNGVDSSTQVPLFSSAAVATSDSLRVTSSNMKDIEAQPFRNLDSNATDRADMHTGTASNNNINSVSVDSCRAEGEAAQADNNADSLEIFDLFGVGSATEVLDEIFANIGDEEFPCLWDAIS